MEFVNVERVREKRIEAKGLRMFVKCFGLFWRRDEVDWNPGTGGQFRLLGRQGERLPGIRIADIREQTGIYILYGNHGAYYVGLTKSSLGIRLKSHLTDQHGDEWDRFSWFGFRKILAGRDTEGFCKLGDMATTTITNPEMVISDVEALLIRAMGLSNIRQMNFYSADEWTQIKNHETEYFLAKIS
jgi:hypothetical protein